MSGRYIGRYAVTDRSRRVAGGDDNEIHIHLVGDSAGYARDTGTITQLQRSPAARLPNATARTCTFSPPPRARTPDGAKRVT